MNNWIVMVVSRMPLLLPEFQLIIPQGHLGGANPYNGLMCFPFSCLSVCDWFLSVRICTVKKIYY